MSLPRKLQLIQLLVCSVLISFIFGCKAGPKNTSITPGNTVIVQLHDATTNTQLEADFVAYKLKKREVISRPLTILLYDFDYQKIADTTLVRLLKGSSLVKEAQPNREVSQRN